MGKIFSVPYDEAPKFGTKLDFTDDAKARLQVDDGGQAFPGRSLNRPYPDGTTETYEGELPPPGGFKFKPKKKSDAAAETEDQFGPAADGTVMGDLAELIA